MFYNLKEYILLKEYCNLNHVASMKVLRNKNIHTIKIGKDRYIQKSTLKNDNNFLVYSDLQYLYPIGEFFVRCGVSKSYKQTLKKQNIIVNIVIIYGVHFIRLNRYFYQQIDNNLSPFIVNRDTCSNDGINHIKIEGIKIAFLES